MRRAAVAAVAAVIVASGGALGAASAGTHPAALRHTCTNARSARVLCAPREPARVCRAALGVSRCWGFAGRDTGVLVTWDGRVAQS